MIVCYLQLHFSVLYCAGIDIHTIHRMSYAENTTKVRKNDDIL